MPYLADYFSGRRNSVEDQEQGVNDYVTPGRGPGGFSETPAQPNGPSGPAGPPGGPTTPASPGGPAGPVAAGPGTGFVPLAAYFAPNREGAQGLAQGLMDKFPSGSQDEIPGSPGYVAGPQGPQRTPADNKVRTALTAAEAGSALANMNPLDSFLARQAGGSDLYARLADWARPYQPPAPPTGTGQVGELGPAPTKPKDPRQTWQENDPKGDPRRRPKWDTL